MRIPNAFDVGLVRMMPTRPGEIRQLPWWWRWWCAWHVLCGRADAVFWGLPDGLEAPAVKVEADPAEE